MIYLKNINNGELHSLENGRLIAQALINPELVEITEEEFKALQPKEVKLAEAVPSYEELVRQKIAQKYSIEDEIAILRQIDQKPREYAEYYNYCEKCKLDAKAELQ